MFCTHALCFIIIRGRNFIGPHMLDARKSKSIHKKNHASILRQNKVSCWAENASKSRAKAWETTTSQTAKKRFFFLPQKASFSTERERRLLKRMKQCEEIQTSLAKRNELPPLRNNPRQHSSAFSLNYACRRRRSVSKSWIVFLVGQHKYMAGII